MAETTLPILSLQKTEMKKKMQNEEYLTEYEIK